jgi:hypothetical protein
MQQDANINKKNKNVSCNYNRHVTFAQTVHVDYISSVGPHNATYQQKIKLMYTGINQDTAPMQSTASEY